MRKYNRRTYSKENRYIKQHCYDVIMRPTASQITSLTTVYAIVYRARSKKTLKLRVTGLCAGNSPETVEFPTQMASNAENVSIWWRHHEHTESENLCSSLVGWTRNSLAKHESVRPRPPNKWKKILDQDVPKSNHLFLVLVSFPTYP